MSNIKKILDLGFEYAGFFKKTSDNIACHWSNENCKKYTEVLYAFVYEKKVHYIGKTTQEFKKRIYGYLKPNTSQATNFRLNENIRKTLKLDEAIEIYIFKPDKIEFKGYAINVAAGLEDSIIRAIQPPWNQMGLGK